jgi:hypothetical protein
MESTFHEGARPVPGIRDLAPLVRAIQRTAPALLGLFLAGGSLRPPAKGANHLTGYVRGGRPATTTNLIRPSLRALALVRNAGA